MWRALVCLATAAVLARARAPPGAAFGWAACASANGTATWRTRLEPDEFGVSSIPLRLAPWAVDGTGPLADVWFLEFGIQTSIRFPTFDVAHSCAIDPAARVRVGLGWLLAAPWAPADAALDVSVRTWAPWGAYARLVYRAASGQTCVAPRTPLPDAGRGELVLTLANCTVLPEDPTHTVDDAEFAQRDVLLMELDAGHGSGGFDAARVSRGPGFAFVIGVHVPDAAAEPGPSPGPPPRCTRCLLTRGPNGWMAVAAAALSVLVAAACGAVATAWRVRERSRKLAGAVFPMDTRSTSAVSDTTTSTRSGITDFERTLEADTRFPDVSNIVSSGTDARASAGGNVASGGRQHREGRSRTTSHTPRTMPRRASFMIRQ